MGISTLSPLSCQSQFHSRKPATQPIHETPLSPNKTHYTLSPKLSRLRGSYEPQIPSSVFELHPEMGVLGNRNKLELEKDAIHKFVDEFTTPLLETIHDNSPFNSPVQSQRSLKEYPKQHH